MIEKRGARITVSDEVMFAHLSRTNPDYGRRASRIEHPITDEQRAQHAEAVELLERLRDNPYYVESGYDVEVYISHPSPRLEVIYLETHEEWLARCREMTRGSK